MVAMALNDGRMRTAMRQDEGPDVPRIDALGSASQNYWCMAIIYRKRAGVSDRL
jgi:hypothetical protein